MKKIMELIDENPVILGIKSEQDVEPAVKNSGKIVFTLFGNIADIVSMIGRLKEAGKIVFVNVDLVDGFESKSSVLRFLKENTETDGIISSKAAMLQVAKELGFYTVHRFFILDSVSYGNISEQLNKSNPDFVNIVPGWSKIIEWTVQEHKKPVIASGLISDRKSVSDSLKAGAAAICTTNHDVWNM